MQPTLNTTRPRTFGPLVVVTTLVTGLVGGLIGGAVGLYLGTALGGPYAAEFQIGDWHGFDAAGTLGALIGFVVVGLGCGFIVARVGRWHAHAHPR